MLTEKGLPVAKTEKTPDLPVRVLTERGLPVAKTEMIAKTEETPDLPVSVLTEKGLPVAKTEKTPDPPVHLTEIPNLPVAKEEIKLPVITMTEKTLTNMVLCQDCQEIHDTVSAEVQITCNRLLEIDVRAMLELRPAMALPSTCPLKMASLSPAQAMQRHSKVWTSLFPQEKFVCGVATEGLRISLTAPPVRPRPPPPSRLSKTLTEEVEKMLKMEAIEPLEKPSPDAFLHSMFEVDKKNSTEKRPILNCKPLNKFVRCEHFKQEGLRTVKELLQPGDYMTSVDLRHAYVHVGIAECHRDLFTFEYNHRWYRYRVMPFGLSSAPRTFTKVIKAAASIVRRMGIRLVIYLDDSLIMAETKELCERHTAIWIRVLQTLGFVINLPKSALTPLQERIFLGHLVNSVSMMISLPEDRKLLLIEHCKKYFLTPLHRKHSARQLARTMGMLTATSECCETSKVYTFHLHQDLLKAKSRGWNSHTVLSDETMGELDWWIRNLPNLQPKPITSALPNLPALLRADASGTGWGAVLYRDGAQRQLAQGLWSQAEKTQSNNVRELTAVVRALEHFLPTTARKDTTHTLHVQSDNTTTVATILKMGNLHSLTLNRLAIQLSTLRRIYSVVLIPCYIQGAVNSTADELSRKTFSLADSRLNPHLFNQINVKWGPLQIDLFASEATTQLPTFCSWAIQPAAWRIDALSFPWTTLKGLWINPPFSMIARCLQKISIERVHEAVILIPMWTAHYWWPMLTRMLIAWPLVIPKSPLTFGLPHQDTPTLPVTTPTWTTAVWLISGDASRSRAFRATWCKDVLNRGRLLKDMIQLGVPGSNGVETMKSAMILLTTIAESLLSLT